PSNDSLGLLLLRLLSGGVGGVLTGLLLAGPLLFLPSLDSSAGLSSRSRLYLWSRLHHEQTKQTTLLLLPLLTISLALCALFAHSADPVSAIDGSVVLTSLADLVAQNRKSLFTLAAVFILAIRPYTFGLLHSRIELLKSEERRLLLEEASNVGGAGARAALGLGKWRGQSPAGSVDGDESDEEDNVVEGVLEREEGEGGKVDTDTLIRELSHLQLGTVFLAGGAFFLTLIELVCV
ncbi:hypothetical protein JCM8547_001345, partial [Rhodosporidiobolus lusitaniae]